jgi:hypothetical protein
MKPILRIPQEQGRSQEGNDLDGEGEGENEEEDEEEEEGVHHCEEARERACMVLHARIERAIKVILV